MSESIYEINERVRLSHPDDEDIQELVSRVEQLAGVSNALAYAIRNIKGNKPMNAAGNIYWAAEQMKIVEHWIDHLLTEADNGA